MEIMPALDADRSTLELLLQKSPAVLVTVVATQGSTPREPGAWLALSVDRLLGSVGGGQLEFQALAIARELLRQGPSHPLDGQLRRYPLGPGLGQCCGGAVELRFDFLADPAALRQLGPPEPAAAPVTIFGAGHVGRALARALDPLPFALHWVDSRDDIFPASLPPRWRVEHSDPVERAVPELEPGSHVLIMTHSHDEDFRIVAACLQRQREAGDLAFIGLIGSQTKWASFGRRLRERGFAEPEISLVCCPVGLPGISCKQPAVIAASVAAQLLTGLTGS
jgi:xanthine dehydrogenase accessory factor